MRRFAKAALAAGVVHAVLILVVMYTVFDPALLDELRQVLARVTGDAPAAGGATDATAGGGGAQMVLHLVLRLLFGFVTVGIFVVLQRRRSRFRAARLAGLWFWVVGYVAWPILLAVKFGMSTTLLFVSMGYGLCETQLAAHAGAIVWGRNPAGKPQ